MSEPPRPSVVTSRGRAHALKAGHEDDRVVVEGGEDAIGAHVEDARLGVRGVGHDARLGPGQRDGAMAEVVDGHGAQGARHALARRQQHVHLARVGVRRDLVGVGDQAVGLLAARAEDGHDAVPGLALGDDALGGALEALGVGHRGASELHDDGCAVHDERRRIRGVRPWVGHGHAPPAPYGPGRCARRRPGRRPPDPRPDQAADGRRRRWRCRHRRSAGHTGRHRHAAPRRQRRRRRDRRGRRARGRRALFVRHRRRRLPDRLLRARRQGPHHRLARDGAGGDEDGRRSTGSRRSRPSASAA